MYRIGNQIYFKIYKYLFILINLAILFIDIYFFKLDLIKYNTIIFYFPLIILLLLILNNMWIYKILQTIVVLVAIFLGFTNTPVFLDFVMLKGEIIPNEYYAYYSIIFMIFSIITLILYYLSQEEINKNKDKNMDIKYSNSLINNTNIKINIEENIKRYSNVYSEKILDRLKKLYKIYRKLDKKLITIDDINIKSISRISTFIFFNKIKLGVVYLDFLVQNLLFLYYLKIKDFKLAYFYFNKVIKYLKIQKNQFHAAVISIQEVFYQYLDNELLLLNLLKNKEDKYVNKIIIKLLKLDKEIFNTFLSNLDLKNEEIDSLKILIKSR